jgi:hypothetical protein
MGLRVDNRTPATGRRLARHWMIHIADTAPDIERARLHDP